MGRIRRTNPSALWRYVVAVTVLFASIVLVAPQQVTAAASQIPATLPAGTVRTPVDGGPGYYGKFSPSLPSSASFFPIGVWLEMVTKPEEVKLDKAAGINTYVALTSSSNLSLLKDSGMNLLAQSEIVNKAGGYAKGWLVSDEADMWAGPGSYAWTGRWPGQGTICSPADKHCGYTVQKTLLGKLPKDKRFRWANYGKGVVFWQPDPQAARFVNEFQHVVSADVYWYTDPNTCSRWEGGLLYNRSNPQPLPTDKCHRAANYGATVKKLRSLVWPRGSKPVWAFVELGHPSGRAQDPSIAPEQIKAAVWSALINGARGITYFNHSFSGRCVSYHILRDRCYAAVRSTVTSVNAQIRHLAPVLNSPTITGLVSRSGWVAYTTKAYNGDLYVFAGSTGTSSQQVKLTTKCPLRGQVNVLGEKRTRTLTNGSWSDSFPKESTVHLYKIPGGAKLCGV